MSERAKDSGAVNAFVDEIAAVCRKHGMSISHQDGHGAFIIELYFDESNIDWLRHAHLQGHPSR